MTVSPTARLNAELLGCPPTELKLMQVLGN